MYPYIHSLLLLLLFLYILQLITKKILTSLVSQSSLAFSFPFPFPFPSFSYSFFQTSLPKKGTYNWQGAAISTKATFGTHLLELLDRGYGGWGYFFFYKLVSRRKMAVVVCRDDDGKKMLGGRDGKKEKMKERGFTIAA